MKEKITVKQASEIRGCTKEVIFQMVRAKKNFTSGMEKIRSGQINYWIDKKSFVEWNLKNKKKGK